MLGVPWPEPRKRKTRPAASCRAPKLHMPVPVLLLRIFASLFSRFAKPFYGQDEYYQRGENFDQIIVDEDDDCWNRRGQDPEPPWQASSRDLAQAPVIGPSVPPGQPAADPASPILPSSAAPTTPRTFFFGTCSFSFQNALQHDLAAATIQRVRYFDPTLACCPCDDGSFCDSCHGCRSTWTLEQDFCYCLFALPGIVDAGVLSTAPPQALEIAAEALGPVPASVASGSGDTSSPSLSLASRHRSRRFDRAPRERIRRNKSKSRGSHRPSAQPYYLVHSSRAPIAMLGRRSAASVKTPRP